MDIFYDSYNDLIFTRSRSINEQLPYDTTNIVFTLNDYRIWTVFRGGGERGENIGNWSSMYVC